MLLAIDTSTRYAGVSLWSEDRIISTLSWYSVHNHTVELMPAIKYVLDRAGAGPSSLEGVAVALGPGGFSALRVGISAAKGLAMPLNIPLVGVGTLEMEAYPYAGTGLPICPLLDVGRSEVAAAVFQESGGHWRRLEQERVCTPEELVESISRPTLLCGEGVSNRGEYLRQALGGKGVVIGFHTQASRLGALGVLAGERLKNGDVDVPATLQPLYLRRPSIGPPKSPRKVTQ
jgi:tRNA threonylcarbamoyladenosine biosynthesis protein TsaB